MKKNLPKFLLATNEAAKPGATYLVHTQHPEFIGEIHQFESLSARSAFVAEHPDRDILQINPTTLLIISRYIVPGTKIADLKYLESKIVHWVVANYLNG